jgi:hypothetical protein
VRNSTFGFLCLALSAAVSSACSSDDPLEDDDPTGPAGEFFMRANIDGPWVAEGFFAAATSPGIYSISGSKGGGTNPYIISLSLYNIGAPGTYPLGTGPTVAGGGALVSTGQGSFTTPLSGADGSITITTLSTQRIAGTFNFTVNGVSAGTSGTKTATNGEFVLPFTPPATSVQIPENFGSQVSATVAGASWNAASASGQYSAASRLVTISSSNNARFINISLNEVTGPGSYPVGTSGRVLSANGQTQTLNNSWSSSGPGSSGSVVITSLTTTRMRGTFSATIGPTPGSSTTGTLAVTNGSFDIGLGASP